jgi:hypothetical protein
MQEKIVAGGNVAIYVVSPTSQPGSSAADRPG